jgi:transcriptional regulator with XRE-family HTH domain
MFYNDRWSNVVSRRPAYAWKFARTELKSSQPIVTVKKHSRGFSMEFGTRMRKLRRDRGLTLRTFAEAAGVDHTYLSKIEKNKPGFKPGAETVRALASALEADSLELLMLAGKVPPELEHMVSSPSGLRFYSRSRAITSPDDWDALSNLVDRQLRGRRTKREEQLGEIHRSESKGSPHDNRKT